MHQSILAPTISRTARAGVHMLNSVRYGMVLTEKPVQQLVWTEKPTLIGFIAIISI